MKILYYISIIFIILVSNSCEVDMTSHVDTPDYVPKLVIMGFISPNDPLSISITKNIPAYGASEDPENIHDAKVIISNDIIQKELVHVGDGIYVLSTQDFSLENAKGYKIKVTTPDGLQAGASCFIPAKRDYNLSIDTVHVYTKVNSYYHDPALDTIVLEIVYREDSKARLKFNDIKGEKNYYRFSAFLTVYYDGEPYNERLDFNDDLISDWGRDGKTIEYTSIHAFSSFFETADSVFLSCTLLDVDYEYYTYHNTLRKYNDYYSNPFAESVQVFSNINGGLGIFCSYLKEEYSMRLK